MNLSDSFQLSMQIRLNLFRYRDRPYSLTLSPNREQARFEVEILDPKFDAF